MRRLLWVYFALLLGGYAWAEWRGLEIGPRRRGVIPQSVRQSPGGYRSYHLWRGGK